MALAGGIIKGQSDGNLDSVFANTLSCIDFVWKSSKRKHLCLKYETVERCREAIETAGVLLMQIWLSQMVHHWQK